MRNKLRNVALIVLLLVSLVPSTALAEEKTIEDRVFKDEIIYDVFIDRLNNGNQKLNEQIDVEDPLTFNGGDIYGVDMRLDSVLTAGFTMVNLSPIMQNAKRGYHGYWIEDFYEVEPQLGTMKDFKKLITNAHKREIKVTMDLVTNYVAKSSPLVDDPDKKDWFKENEVTPIPATEWLDDVYVLDQTNPEVQDYLIDVAKHWMTETDVDGFTLHAADQMEPAFIEKLLKEIKELNPDFHVMASTLHPDTRGIEYLYDYAFDGIENWELAAALNDTFTEVDAPISALYEQTKEITDERNIMLVDNQNTARFSNNFAEKGRNDITTWKLALAYMYFTPGVAKIYQGSEVPMYGPNFPEIQNLVDFTSANPDLEKAFNQAAAIRKEFPSIVHGDFEEVATEQGLSVFKHTLDEETVFVVINNDDHSRYVPITGIEEGMQLRGLLYDDTVRAQDNGEYVVGVDRESADVFVVQEDKGFAWGLILFAGGIFTLFVVAVIVLGRKQKQREKAAQENAN